MFYEHRKVVNALYSKDVSPLKRNLVANYNSSVDDLFNHFIGYLDASPNTVSTYKRDLQQWFNYVTENHINQPTRNTVLQYRKYLVDNGKKNTTVQNYITAVKQLYNWAASENLAPNIARHIKTPKVGHDHKKDPLTAKQARHVLESIDQTTLTGKRDYAIVALLMSTGLRTIELSRANVGDLRLELDNRVLYIQGKGHDEKDSFVKVPVPVYHAIKNYLDARHDKVTNDSALFASTSNNSKWQTLTTRSISKIAKESMVNAGYDSDRLTAHSLRHTAATLNILNGGTLEETQQLLRHVNINTTLIYEHEIDRLKSKSEERIASAIFK
ncbi:tyrosine-type recombinase/integrase [Lentilactobacillus kefiri]|nr:tyrosine-type recombinase/integrase [Lentilactobacillus kefiri]